MTRSTPRVSVLLPVKDAETTLPECLDSLHSQTLEDHEVVAVDDGSRDGSRELLDQAAARDPRVRVLSAEVLGLVPALNAALAGARAPIVARMDADDRAHPDRLRLQTAALEEDPATDILGTRVRHFGGRDNEGMRAYVEWSNELVDDAGIRRDLFVESPLVHPSVALRTLALRGLGGYRAYDGPEDYDLWLRAAAAGMRFRKLQDVLLEWRDSPTRLTRQDPRYAPGRFLARKLEALREGPLGSGRPAVVWGAGEIGKAWARALAAEGVALLAFVEVDPHKLGQRIHGAPVVTTLEAGTFPSALHLAAVGQRGARARIRGEALRAGLPPDCVVAVA
jgi:glycosyltransferase involved in cell wall biosynthesis